MLSALLIVPQAPGYRRGEAGKLVAGRPRGGGGSRPEGQGQPQEEPDERGHGHGDPGHGQHQGAGGPDRGAHDALLSVSGLTSPTMTMTDDHLDSKAAFICLRNPEPSV